MNYLTNSLTGFLIMVSLLSFTSFSNSFSQQPSANMLENAGFNTNAGWLKSYWNYHAGSQWHSVFGYSGGGYYLYTSRENTNTGYSFSNIYQFIDKGFSEEDTLNVSVQLGSFRANLSPGSYGYIRAVFYQNGSTLDTYQINLNWDEYNKPEWTTLSGKYIIPVGTTKILFVLGIYGMEYEGTYTQSTLAFDNPVASVVPKVEVPPDPCSDIISQTISKVQICAGIKGIVGLSCDEIEELKRTGAVSPKKVNIRGQVR